MLEKMDAFFEVRLDGYDEHMMTGQGKEFYAFTAGCLPVEQGCSLLDLGCGTGLELEGYFALNPSARVTGIDLSKGMLAALTKKFPDKDITLRCESYFDSDLGKDVYDAAVSVESLHHFTKAEKIPLYRNLRDSLKMGGCFILTDYFAASDDEEETFQKKLIALKQEEGIGDGFYHFDTPLTVAHETEALLEAGFTKVETLNQWETTVTLRAVK